ncbi:MAG: TetR/AcrR family transcriptional regulator [Pseudomonas sp.]|uniref:TetR/AcrR family transcriptional regulator n=1 Tax=Pseudomonas abieticivorans TaxID=2931382 RepID=UPI0020BF3B30|nr:TetR/AcrR family transcriptional regulator [Pseudomonas sp. PIA16]MDE1166463.1 TetR/AcrR family transcriptional regulator [Pseudomonas sp.]
MARPKSEDKRNAILDAATQVFAEQGLAAPTSKIAKGAGVAEGTLFNYFATKDELLNALYLVIKGELREVLLSGTPADDSLKAQLHHAWSRYVAWGVRYPHKRKVCTQLTLCDRLTEVTRAQGMQALAELTQQIDLCVASGALRDHPPAFIPAILGSLAETTMDFMVKEPASAERYAQAGFEAFWHAIAA